MLSMNMIFAKGSHFLVSSVSALIISAAKLVQGRLVLQRLIMSPALRVMTAVP